MRIQANIGKGEYGFLRRRSSGAWDICAQDVSYAVVEPTDTFANLNLDEYRLLGWGDGTASVIRFADLHRHSYFSFMDSCLKIPDMVKGTEYAGALTDHGNMYGFLEYYKAMKKAGKKPIIGTEAYMEDMEGNLAHRHVILLAKDMTGYTNLLKISSESFEHLRSAFPHVTWELLEQYHEGIICLSACLAGVIPTALLNNDWDTARKAVERFKGLFGEDFYIEIQNHGIPEENRVRPMLISLAQEYDIKVAATTDTHYLMPEDREAHQALLCLRTDSTLDAPKLSYDGEGYWLHTSEDMEKRFKDYPEALDTTLEIADKCNVELELGKVQLPNYDIPESFENPHDYMCHIVEEGFKSRFEGTSHLNDPEYLNRVKYEEDMIAQMGFSSYFIIVWDYINFARQHNIWVGPGRGSAAGSIVAYCMGITDIDPIKYNLLFERFLNPERVSWPDIDTDIEARGRPLVIQYMRDKYGHNNVCRIAAPGKFAAKRAILDIARVLGLPVSVGRDLASMVPAKPGITIQKAMEPGSRLANRVASDSTAKRIISLAQKIEGCFRHASVHACGVCVAPSMVSDYIPTAMILDHKTDQRVLCTQVTKEEVEELGLIKMDLLGLQNLDVAHETISRVIKNLGKDKVRAEIGTTKKTIEYHDIPLNDRATYELFRSGKTGGVFQFEGEEISKLVQSLLWDLDAIPDDKLADVAFERLVAANALYRPGPMDYIPDYVAGVQNPECVHYDCPEEESVLSSTYGVMVYQEQLIHVAQKLAGYNMGEADILRKACGKKKKELLIPEHKRFVNGNKKDYEAGKDKHYIPGCVENGIQKKVAEEIWSKIEKFGEYAFNRSHSVCYAYIGYITAYMSVHWPCEFYAAMLNAFIDDTKKIKSLLYTVNRRGVKVLLPDIQKSEEYFVGGNGQILFGLKGIKGIQKTAADIIAERNRGGEFANLQDLYERLANRDSMLSNTAINGLVFSGALSKFSDNKKALLTQYELIKTNYETNGRRLAAGQTTLFGEEMQQVPLPEETPFLEQTEREKEAEVLGVYVSKHPTDLYKKKLAEHPEFTALELLAESEAEVSNAKTLGMIQGWRPFTTKGGEIMAAFTLETKFSSLNCLMFPKQYAQYGNQIDNAVVCVEGGLVRDRQDSTKWQLIIRQVMKPQDVLNLAAGTVIVQVHNRAEQDEVLRYVREHPGDLGVTLEGYGRYFPLKGKVEDSAQTRQFFDKISGKAN